MEFGEAVTPPPTKGNLTLNDNFNNAIVESDVHDVEGSTSSRMLVLVDEAAKCVQGAPPSEFCEAETSELLNKEVSSLDDAYELYNEYAFKIGFRIRRNRTRWCGGKDKGLRGQEFCCSREGFKKVKGTTNKAYTKKDSRCGCRAMVYFEFDVDKGVWICLEHLMVHNHDFVQIEHRHLVRSHKKVCDKEFEFLSVMKSSGVGLALGCNVLKKEAGGSPCLGFSMRDVYNRFAIVKKKSMIGCDANTLVQKLFGLSRSERDFYFDFDLDESGSLVSLFWRDEKMKFDFEKFGDVLIFDNTYGTNKYDLICGPFVGINNHRQNVVFGCGLMINENTETLKWLFSKFFESMNSRLPVSIMTDQSQAMSNAIEHVFPRVAHRLCTWHIEKNTQMHLRTLMSDEAFVRRFDHCLRNCQSVDEFHECWSRLLVDFDCSDNDWLGNLYMLRAKWCPPFTSDVFTGGILSSQRSESANSSLKDKLCRQSDLVDFYSRFNEFVSVWRSKEKHETYRCASGVLEHYFARTPLIRHALDVYTFGAFGMFDKEFQKIMLCTHEVLDSDASELAYKVYVNGRDEFVHVVVFNPVTHDVSCTCKKISSHGVLCCHCLRIYFIHNVPRIPDKYFLRRWTKAMGFLVGDVAMGLIQCRG